MSRFEAIQKHAGWDVFKLARGFRENLEKYGCYEEWQSIFEANVNFMANEVHLHLITFTSLVKLRNSSNQGGIVPIPDNGELT